MVRYTILALLIKQYVSQFRIKNIFFRFSIQNMSNTFSRVKIPRFSSMNLKTLMTAPELYTRSQRIQQIRLLATSFCIQPQKVAR